MQVAIDRPIHIGLVDDDFLLLELLKNYLEQYPQRFRIQMMCTDGTEALSRIQQEDKEVLDVLIIDLKMDGMDGLTLLQELKKEHTTLPVIVLSSHYQDNSLGFMVKNGVAAFLPKGISLNTLVEVISHVAKYQFYLLPAQVAVVRTQLSASSPPPAMGINMLSTREVEVLQLLSQQKTAKEIADTLYITSRTVEGHKSNLFAKTGAKNLAGLVIFAIQHKLVDPNQLYF